MEVKNANKLLNRIIKTASQTEVEKFQEKILFITKMMIAMSTNRELISIVLLNPDVPYLLDLLIVSYVVRIISTGILLTGMCKCLCRCKQISKRFTVQDTISLCVSILIQKAYFMIVFKSEDSVSFPQQRLTQKTHLFLTMTIEFMILFFDRKVAHIAIEKGQVVI